MTLKTERYENRRQRALLIAKRGNAKRVNLFTVLSNLMRWYDLIAIERRLESECFYIFIHLLRCTQSMLRKWLKRDTRQVYDLQINRKKWEFLMSMGRRWEIIKDCCGKTFGGFVMSRLSDIWAEESWRRPLSGTTVFDGSMILLVTRSIVLISSLKLQLIILHVHFILMHRVWRFPYFFRQTAGSH